jgi:hypothetical protein
MLAVAGGPADRLAADRGRAILRLPHAVQPPPSDGPGRDWPDAAPDRVAERPRRRDVLPAEA